MTRRRRALPWLALCASLAAGSALAQTPSRAGTGDFDGDGKIDRASLDIGPKFFEVVVRTARGRFVLDSGRAEDAGNLYVKAAPPGEYQDVCLEEDDAAKCPPPVKVKNAAVEFGAEESASVIYYWDGKRFRKVQTSD